MSQEDKVKSEDLISAIDAAKRIEVEQIEKKFREAPETLIEIDARFPPKKTRPLTGKLTKKGRAEFKTAFDDSEVKP